MLDKQQLIKDIHFTILPRVITILAFSSLAMFLVVFNFIESPMRILFWFLIWLITIFPFEKLANMFKTGKAIERFQFLYFLLEFFFLTVIIHYLGGIAWVGGVFYTFTIIYANILFSKKLALYLTFLGALMFNILVFLELFAVLPHYVIFVGNDFFSNPNYIWGTVINLIVVNILLISVGFFINSLGRLLRNKKIAWQNACQKIEEQKEILEIKINARTKQASEMAAQLKEKVAGSTKDLNAKVKELEKFNKLALGREERLKNLMQKFENE
jgi:hypothetical protein